MADLIDRAALKKHFADLVQFNRLPRETKELCVEDIEDLIDHQPTVEAEPVVRCKDCLHAQGAYLNNTVECLKGHKHMNLDAFCSDGQHMDADVPERAGKDLL